jgi:hypothetical protein
MFDFLGDIADFFWNVLVGTWDIIVFVFTDLLFFWAL